MTFPPKGAYNGLKKVYNCGANLYTNTKDSELINYYMSLYDCAKVFM